MEIPEIKFGTDGWRGIIADDFTFANMALVGSAIRAYLLETEQGDKPLIIGYDRRFAALEYAAHLGNHLASLGQEVILTKEPCPTPVVAFGVSHLKAAGAVMLTASHNPYYYQGLKFIPHFAGPAMPKTTDRITALIQELAAEFNAPALAKEWTGGTVSLKQPYFDHLDQIVNVNSLSSSKVKVLYNPMHGLGAGYLDDYLKHAGVEVITINAERDVYFGGGMPDPSPSNLVPLAAKLIEEDCDLLIGTDGDADRFGLVDQEGRYFGANHALPLLADFLIRYKEKSGTLVRTVSTSHLVDRVATEHDLPLIETAVGFKYVGDELRRGALIGGEESGGISIIGHLPEKDGLLTSLLLLEMMATTGEDLQNLISELMTRLGGCYFVRLDEEMAEDAKQALLGAMAGYSEETFAGRVIDKRIDIDGVKLVFTDGSWVLLRASGTEPLVRIYLEAASPEALNKLKKDVLEQVKKLLG